MPAYRVLEQSTTGKTSDDSCEDYIVCADRHLAVIDGATDKTGISYGGETGGRYTARILAETIPTLPVGATARETVDLLTKALAAHLPAGHGPCASILIVSLDRREIWQVGDVSYALVHAGRLLGEPVKTPLEEHMAAVRAAYTTALLNTGHPVEELRASDPGRQAIMPLLALQGGLQNRTGPWSFGVLDGTPVPPEHLHVTSLPARPVELVVHTDGYPRAAGTLSDAETLLARLLEEDPLCIGPLAGTKAWRPGTNSYDDRAYLRVRI